MKQPHVVIVGGGFGGLSAAKALANQPVKVTLIDKRNYHLFQPLLYQVATAGLSPAEIAAPLRSILAGKDNIDVLMGHVETIDLAQKKLTCDFGEVTFDKLVLACGAAHSYFGNDAWEEYAPGLKTIEQATEIRRRVYLAFEKAERSTSSEEQRRHLTFVVVGAGPTGVELAGALGEITRNTLKRDFHRSHPERARVLLVEAGPKILASFPDELSQEAQRNLEALGVQVWTSTRVTNIHESGITLANETVEASTVIWAAGVKPSALNQQLSAEKDRAGRVKINDDLTLPGSADVFVIGDQSAFQPVGATSALPGLAPVAMQQGRWAAANILRATRGQPLLPYVYFDKGQMATIGRSKAVAQYKGLTFTGFIAWVMWLVVHIYYLIGFKNRLFVLYQWARMWFTFTRGARLIVDKEWRLRD